VPPGAALGAKHTAKEWFRLLHGFVPFADVSREPHRQSTRRAANKPRAKRATRPASSRAAAPWPRVRVRAPRAAASRRACRRRKCSLVRLPRRLVGTAAFWRSLDAAVPLAYGACHT